MSDKIHTYASDDVTVSWDGALCIHAAECTRGLRAVFDPKQKPWIQPDKADLDAISEVVARCPTGALTARRRDGRTEAPPARNTVRMTVNGPHHVRGALTIGDAPAPGAGTRVALCRCGRSGNFPYCDNSHKEAGFRHDGRAEAGELGEPGAGPMKITAFDDGPLQLDGPIELQDRDGNPVWRGEQTWLCRCGQSQNKPFCDGTHRRVGFKTS